MSVQGIEVLINQSKYNLPFLAIRNFGSLGSSDLFLTKMVSIRG